MFGVDFARHAHVVLVSNLGDGGNVDLALVREALWVEHELEIVRAERSRLQQLGQLLHDVSVVLRVVRESLVLHDARNLGVESDAHNL